ncbi:NADH-quinone oxidoreductase subunit N [Bacteriovoracaceae bacterium]|nr:NADH-quinone oxidoreductase subunit N [Bacteriovoracaceae bacterium]
MGLNYLVSLGHYVPELIVCITMFSLILIEAAHDKDATSKPLIGLTSFIGLISAFVILVLNLSKPGLSIFTNSIVIDSFGTFAKIIMVLGTLGAIYIAEQSSDIYQKLKSEFSIMAMGVLVGGMLLTSANNMLLLYIGLETLSILSYVMATLKKNNERSGEAGLKYSLYGGISAGIMLFGMSHVFGVLGTINFSEMATMIPNLTSDQMLILIPSFLLFFVGLGYKIACVPFHMWSPDVYEGSPIPVTAFFAIVPKIAGMAVIARLTMLLFNNDSLLSVSWIGALSVMAALTMTVGNISAIGQRSVKRMLAYSSIGHAGVMLLGIVVVSEIGLRSLLFYAFTYLFMTLVAFYIVSFVNDTYGNDHFDRFSGLIYKHPIMTISMIIVMFSLAGIPPLSGFVAKFNIFSAVVAKKYYVLAIIAGINSVISLYYYMKIIRLMVFKTSESENMILGLTLRNQLIIGALTVPVVTLGVFWEKIIGVAEQATLLIQ